MESGIDQAGTLRQDSNAQQKVTIDKSMRCITVASGKGGVGKTFFAVNTAVQLQRSGHKVLLLDADLGLANADILLGTTPSYTLQDNVFSGVPLGEIVVKGPHEVDLLAANSGSGQMLKMGRARMQMLVEDLLEFASDYDVFILDCAAGINDSVMSFVNATPQCALVTTPEPTAIMDAYALMKVAEQRKQNGKFGLVMNNTRDVRQGNVIADKLVKMGKEYLSCDVEKWGVIPNSDMVWNAIRAKKPIMAYAPQDKASKSIAQVSKYVLQRNSTNVNLDKIDAEGVLDGLFKREKTV